MLLSTHSPLPYLLPIAAREERASTTRRRRLARPSHAPSPPLPRPNFDPDYLYFLRHLRPDGDSYVLELPPGGASPTTVIKYKPPIAIASSNGECVSDPSPGRGSTNRRTEEKSVDAPPPSWLDSLIDIDEDCRIFLQHTRDHRL
jgi:hypothetical protein